MRCPIKTIATYQAKAPKHIHNHLLLLILSNFNAVIGMEPVVAPPTDQAQRKFLIQTNEQQLQKLYKLPYAATLASEVLKKQVNMLETKQSDQKAILNVNLTEKTFSVLHPLLKFLGKPKNNTLPVNDQVLALQNELQKNVDNDDNTQFMRLVRIARGSESLQIPSIVTASTIALASHIISKGSQAKNSSTQERWITLLAKKFDPNGSLARKLKLALVQQSENIALFLMQNSESTSLPVPKSFQGAYSFALSPDETTALIIHADGEQEANDNSSTKILIDLVNLKDFSTKTLMTYTGSFPPSFSFPCAFSPKGDYVAYTIPSRGYIHNLKDDMQHEIPHRNARVTQAVFSLNGESVLFGLAKGDAIVINIPNKKTAAITTELIRAGFPMFETQIPSRFTLASNYDHSTIFSSDGSKIARNTEVWGVPYLDYEHAKVLNPESKTYDSPINFSRNADYALFVNPPTEQHSHPTVSKLDLTQERPTQENLYFSTSTINLEEDTNTEDVNIIGLVSSLGESIAAAISRTKIYLLDIQENSLIKIINLDSETQNLLASDLSTVYNTCFSPYADEFNGIILSSASGFLARTTVRIALIDHRKKKEFLHKAPLAFILYLSYVDRNFLKARSTDLWNIFSTCDGQSSDGQSSSTFTFLPASVTASFSLCREDKQTTTKKRPHDQAEYKALFKDKQKRLAAVMLRLNQLPKISVKKQEKLSKKATKKGSELFSEKINPTKGIVGRIYDLIASFAKRLFNQIWDFWT